MATKILVPLAGSALAERALNYASALALDTGGSLLLLHVRSAYVPSSDAAVDLESLAEHVRRDGVAADTLTYDLYTGGVGGVITDAARDRTVDFIVMSTHGRGGLGRWMYGSVADQVVRQAEVPVLLVPAECARLWPDRGQRSILIALDGSKLAEDVLGRAEELARTTGGTVHLLQVIEPPNYGLVVEGAIYIPVDVEAEVDAAKAYLTDVAGRLRSNGADVTTSVRVGYPAVVIPSVAEEERVDLIMMATHGRGGFARAMLGSVATGTLQRSTVPVLLIRPLTVQRVTAAIGPGEAETRSDGPKVTLALTAEDLSLLELSLRDLLYGQQRDWRLARPARELLEELKQARQSVEDAAPAGAGA
jgi:nucleotide-binding universal stress UspA family protein